MRKSALPSTQNQTVARKRERTSLTCVQQHKLSTHYVRQDNNRLNHLLPLGTTTMRPATFRLAIYRKEVSLDRDPVTDTSIHLAPRAHCFCVLQERRRKKENLCLLLLPTHRCRMRTGSSVQNVENRFFPTRASSRATTPKERNALWRDARAPELVVHPNAIKILLKMQH